ncbi:MFS transporter [Lactococcus lactis]|uniref:MFS transporter n=1 Tax=Lactococcus lactis TaxID=1358 RepID=UPI0028BE19C1|nr:MFS transporter [Lactococcus lactis]WNN67346.1 MFS transporter [Lactococcus lactis]WPK09907.1 MFS transporter [Lactococcus lactis]
MELKLFNKHFIGITLINFVVYFIYYLLMVIIAFVSQKSLHSTVSQAGFATGIYVIGTLLARLIMGKQIELIGRRRVLRYSSIFFVITNVSYLFTPNYVYAIASILPIICFLLYYINYRRKLQN